MTVRASDSSTDDNPIPALRRSIASGRTILVLGDIYDQDNEGGSQGTGALRSALIKIATSGAHSDDPNASLDEALRAAKRKDPEAAQNALTSCIGVGERAKRVLRSILTGPWERIYNLSPLDLPKALEDQINVGGLSYIDARSEFRIEHDRNQIVDFCGVGSSGGDLQFSVPTGAGKGPADNWFRQFAADLVSRPVLVLATSSHSDLWSFMRPRSESVGATIAPGFLCLEIKSLTDDLRGGNCSLADVGVSLEELCHRCLAPNINDVADGHRMLARIRNGKDVRVGAQLVTNLLRRSEPLSWEFLRGHDPHWADVAAGRTVRLSRLSLLYRNINTERGKRNTALLKGRSGSGKTALLMRLAYELETKGLVVVWIDRSASDRVSDMVKQVESLGPDVALIDDLDIFGDSSGSFVRRLNRGGQTLVVGTVRTTRMWAIETPSNMCLVDGDSDLTDNDLKGLLGKLEEAGLLGELLRTPEPDRVRKLRELSKRDLLAALIQVVTGQPFEQRVQSEYDQLAYDEQNAYSLICFGASRIYEATYLPEQDLLQMLTPAPPYGDSMAAIANLVRSGLIVRDELGLRVRHRVIADAVVKKLGGERIAEIVDAMLIFYASRAAKIKDPSHPDRRQLIHLLSHSHMKDLGLGPNLVRPIYEKAQPLLADDFHFWLQRGAYEVERGDLDLADSYLESARACRGGDIDFKVITEWGFMRLLKAKKNGSDRTAQAKAVRAVSELEQIARREGQRSPHTFTILIRHGTEWLEDAPLLGAAERQGLALRIRDVLQLGMGVVRENRDFARAANEVKAKLDALASGGEDSYAFPLA